MPSSSLLILVWSIGTVLGHGSMTIPSGRNNASYLNGGDCFDYECFWFSQIVEIPGIPTVNESKYRTINVDISDGSDKDFTKTMPWRAPGSAPVHGHGCGVAGGSNIPRDNGGIPPPWIKQGVDGITLPKSSAVRWKRGSTQEVAWAMLANHGGGYSYRLCPNMGGVVSEECFQQHQLDFAGTKQWLRFRQFQQWDKLATIPDIELDRVTVNVGTYPSGSQWARNPVPACKLCDQAECMKKTEWIQQQHCSQECSGLNISVCPPYTAQFPEPAPGISGYFKNHQGNENSLGGFDFNIVDLVTIPEKLKPGDYILSWRWDAEQSRQIWQNCADIVLE